MKRRVGKVIAGACVAGMALTAPGCAFFDVVENMQQAMYGPPPMHEAEEPEFDAPGEMNICLYGPPEMFAQATPDPDELADPAAGQPDENGDAD